MGKRAPPVGTLEYVAARVYGQRDDSSRKKRLAGHKGGVMTRAFLHSMSMKCPHCGERVLKRPLESWRHITGPTATPGQGVGHWFYCEDGTELYKVIEAKGH